MDFFLYTQMFFVKYFFLLQVLSSPSAKFREVCKNGCTTNASAVYKMVNQSHLKLINNLVAKKKYFMQFFSSIFLLLYLLIAKDGGAEAGRSVPQTSGAVGGPDVREEIISSTMALK